MAKDILLGDKEFMYEETETGFSFFRRIDENMRQGVFLKSPLSNHDSFILGLREYLKYHKNVTLSDIQTAYEKRPREDAWIKTDDKQYETEPDEKLKHTFADTTVEFGIRYPLSDEHSETVLIFKREPDGSRLGINVGNIEAAKELVDNTIQHFDKEQNMSMLDIHNYLKSKKVELQKEAEIKNPQDITFQLAKKAGYVQGVCECVAAIGDDHTLGKKLLSEMNVTKDMAKKFANPETFKALEQGIFAPQQNLIKNEQSNLAIDSQLKR